MIGDYIGIVGQVARATAQDASQVCYAPPIPSALSHCRPVHTLRIRNTCVLIQHTFITMHPKYQAIHKWIHPYTPNKQKINVHAYTHTYIHTHIHTHVHSYIHTYIHTYIHIHTHIPMFVHAHVMHIHIRSCMSQNMHVCICVCIHLLPFLHACIPS